MWPQETPNLKLPYIVAAQAQKHVTHNESIRALDAIVHIAILDRDLTAPPATPADGDRYIVATDATGAWLGQSGNIAARQDGFWQFYQPREGWLVWVGDEGILLIWDGASWSTFGGGDESMPMVGINATADATNRLSVSAPASLFNHEGAGHQQKINKATAGDTASVLYQTNWSGRAEVGLTGDDDFHFKVSADGSAWHDGLIIDRSTGKVRFPSGGVREVLQANRVYHVATTGSNANNGLTVGAPLQTIAAAIAKSYQIDSNGFTVTIQLADGVYTATIAADMDRAIVGGARLVIAGNASAPGNVILRGTYPASRFRDSAVVALQHLQLETSSNGSLMLVERNADVFINNVTFTTTSRYQMEIQFGGRVTQVGACTISGGGAAHISLTAGGIFSATTMTTTLTGTPAFSGNFLAVSALAIYSAWDHTWTGAATGRRYNVTINGVVNTFGKGASHFPGDVAGVTGTGGQYN